MDFSFPWKQTIINYSTFLCLELPRLREDRTLEQVHTSMYACINAVRDVERKAIESMHYAGRFLPYISLKKPFRLDSFCFNLQRSCFDLKVCNTQFVCLNLKSTDTTAK